MKLLFFLCCGTHFLPVPSDEQDAHPTNVSLEFPDFKPGNSQKKWLKFIPIRAGVEYTQLGPGLGKKVIAHIPASAKSPPAAWDELTPREQEVLRLIATGASNREIAQTLYIAEKTVKNHVTNILSRLNLRDRTQAAIFVKERGL